MSPKIIATLFGLAAAGPVSALTIAPTFVDAVGFTRSTEMKDVVYAAIDDRTSVIGDAHTINVTLGFPAMGTDSHLAVRQGGVSTFVGADLCAWSPGVTHNILVNTSHLGSANPLWFDPTPRTSDDIPVSRFDALSVMRHEIGHMLGFSNSFYQTQFGTDDAYDKWGSLITAGVFDADGLNVNMDPDPGPYRAGGRRHDEPVHQQRRASGTLRDGTRDALSRLRLHDHPRTVRLRRDGRRRPRRGPPHTPRPSTPGRFSGLTRTGRPAT